jgi:toxin-antitoxin system PIN domain toxin
MHLLDINVLLALCDEAHEFHEPAWTWFAPHRPGGWATCPLTENGFVRIFGHPAHPTGPGSVNEARALLEKLCQGKGHQFWADDASLTDRGIFAELSGVGTRALTDLYLLGLAASKSGRFATFDRKIAVQCVRGGMQSLEVIAV